MKPSSPELTKEGIFKIYVMTPSYQAGHETPFAEDLPGYKEKEQKVKEAFDKLPAFKSEKGISDKEKIHLDLLIN